MKQVFLDTVGLLALWHKNDQWHDAAAIAMKRIVTDRAPAVTTGLVLCECGNAVARRTTRRYALQLRQWLLDTDQLIEVLPADEEAGWQAYRVNHPGHPGIVDEISFAVMRRLGISTAFTNDRHFREAGFTTLF